MYVCMYVIVIYYTNFGCISNSNLLLFKVIVIIIIINIIHFVVIDPISELYVCMYVRMYVCMYVCTYMYVFTSICMYVYIYLILAFHKALYYYNYTHNICLSIYPSIQADDGWFSKRCRKINHSVSVFSYILPSFLSFSEEGMYVHVIQTDKHIVINNYFRSFNTNCWRWYQKYFIY